MGQQVLSLDIVYEKNRGEVMSASELRSIYFYGIKIQDRTGQSLPNDTFTFFIEAAQREIEKYLGIKIQPQIVQESLDFYLDEFVS